jgi:DNA-binding CsgD family transcriptional regulator
VSAAELRLMMLLKLGLNNKQVAETLLITIDGVKKAKYRLYKKIGIGSTEEMKEFLS